MADNLNRMLRALFILALFLVSSLPRSPRANRPPAESWEPDSVPDAFSRPAAALMWPGATRAFLVEPDGCFYNGIWRVDVAATADGRRAAPPRRIAYEGRWRPIAHWTQRAGDVRWDFEAVALPAPEDAFAAWTRDISDGLALRADRGARAAWRRSLTADERDRVDRPSGASSRLARPAGEPVPLVVSVLATARNTGPLAAHATLDLALAPAGAAEPWYEDGPHRAPPSWGWCAPGVDSALGWCEIGRAHV